MSKLDPEQRADALVKSLFQQLLYAIRQHEVILLEQHSEYELHQFRICIRKTRSLLNQCKGVLPANRLSRFRREFGWIADLTSAPRDLDVYLLALQKEKHRYRIAYKELEPFVVFLEDLRETEYAKLYENLGSVRYARLIQDWAVFLDTPVPPATSLRYADKSILYFSKTHTQAFYKRVLKQGNKITRGSSDQAVHELRKSCKKLRYVMEFFREFYPEKKIAVQIKQLKRLQNELGEFQDLCVQQAILNKFITALDKDLWAPASTRQVMDKLHKRQLKQKKIMHKNIPDVFGRFARAENIKQCGKLFH